VEANHGKYGTYLVALQPLGVRAVIVTNSNATEFSVAELEEHQETWASYPDAVGRENVTYYPGDYRMAMAPLIAHR
jgi:hypothetical protein